MVILYFGLMKHLLHRGILSLDSMAATSASSSSLGQNLNVHISYSGEESNLEISELYNTLMKDHDIQSLSLKSPITPAS